MKTRYLNPSKLSPLALAVLLQLAPLCKFFQWSPALATSPLAIVLKWAVGAAVTLGGYHAVSGASCDPVRITSAASSTATNGVAYAYTITQCSPNGDRGHGFSASPLPPGLTVTTIEGNDLPAVGRITGVPGASGVWIVHLAAYYTNGNQVLSAVPMDMTLTVFGRPAITAPPASQTNIVGGTVNFSVMATGLPPPVLRWRFNATNTLSGQTNSTLVLSNLTLAQEGNYSVVASNSYGSVTSAVATLTVKGPSGPPGIIGHPQPATVLAGGSTAFSVVAYGAPPLRYVWRRNSTPIPGGTNAMLNVSNITTNDIGDYSVIVSNSLSSVTSAAAALNVIGAPFLWITPGNAGEVILEYDQLPGASYWLEFQDLLAVEGWLLWFDLPPVSVPTHHMTPMPVSEGSAVIFRQGVTLP